MRIQVLPLLMDLILSSTMVVLMGYYGVCGGKMSCQCTKKMFKGSSKCFSNIQSDIECIVVHLKRFSFVFLLFILLWYLLLTTDTIHL